MVGLDADDGSVFSTDYRFYYGKPHLCAAGPYYNACPGTPLYINLEREGRILPCEFSNYTGGKVVFRPVNLEPDDLEKQYWEMYKKLFSWPAIFKRIFLNRASLGLYMRAVVWVVNLKYRQNIHDGICPGYYRRSNEGSSDQAACPYHTIGLKHIMLCEPLELEYVAAGLGGHEVEIFDMMIEGGWSSGSGDSNQMWLVRVIHHRSE